MPHLPGGVVKDVNFWVAVFTAAAAVAATASTFIILYTAKSAEHVTIQGQLLAQMLTYQTAYEQLVNDPKLFNDQKNPFQVNNYIALSLNEKIRVQIVDAMLVSVVDLMYQINDPRAKVWAGFIQAIPGPLSCGFPLEVYASQKETIDVIDEARKRSKEVSCVTR